MVAWFYGEKPKYKNLGGDCISDGRCRQERFRPWPEKTVKYSLQLRTLIEEQEGERGKE